MWGDRGLQDQLHWIPEHHRRDGALCQRRCNYGRFGSSRVGEQYKRQLRRSRTTELHRVDLTFDRTEETLSALFERHRLE